ncbi:Protein of unknown function [Gryllus bimaculatus]|nr:Protein of unknown function [Gryllus bimaculatus]
MKYSYLITKVAAFQPCHYRSVQSSHRLRLNNCHQRLPRTASSSSSPHPSLLHRKYSYCRLPTAATTPTNATELPPPRCSEEHFDLGQRSGGQDDATRYLRSPRLCTKSNERSGGAAAWRCRMRACWRCRMRAHWLAILRSAPNSFQGVPEHVDLDGDVSNLQGISQGTGVHGRVHCKMMYEEVDENN